MTIWLKSINRGLLELSLGILFLGLICLIAGVWLVKEPIAYCMALLIGILLALVTVYHMYRTLDRALEPGRDAVKAVTAANLIRYGCIVIAFFIVWLTGRLNPLITFLGLMTLKGAAYMQPLTHKVCNTIFHEIDPVPMTQEEYEASRAECEDCTDIQSDVVPDEGTVDDI